MKKHLRYFSHLEALMYFYELLEGEIWHLGFGKPCAFKRLAGFEAGIASTGSIAWHLHGGSLLCTYIVDSKTLGVM